MKVYLNNIFNTLKHTIKHSDSCGEGKYNVKQTYIHSDKQKIHIEENV